MKGRTVKDFENEYNPSAEIVHLRKQVAELKARRLQERAATGEALEIVHALKEAIVVSKPVRLTYKPKNTKSKARVTHVLHLSDLHYGEVVDKDELDGFGEYSPAIAEARLATLTRKIIRKTEIQRNGYNVPALHIIGTGDYISGLLHPEQAATNAFPCPVQAVRCGYMLGAMLMAFAPHFETVVADFVTLDNHGRMTKKPQSAQGGYNNWGYVVAEVAAQHARLQANVQVNIHAKPTALITIGPERYLAMHGHQIKGWAGKPYYGFDRRVAMEAVKRLGVPENAFTKLVLGHFHHGMNGDTWLLGGSLSGTNCFDHSCGRHSKPHQTSWFVHPEHGEHDWTRWTV